MRFDADCRIRSATPDLKEWKPENRVAFVDQLKCVNHQLASVTDEILLRDPTAIVVLQSDHGSAFRGQFVPGADTSWNGSQIAERLGVLNAMRVPEACRASVQEMRSLVNTYAVVLACIHASKPVLAPDRYFNTPYDNSPNFGKVFELR
jgi:hypothetical protein